MQKATWRTSTSARTLVTRRQPITKSSMREVNLVTSIDTQSLYRLYPLNGFNRTRAKRQLLRRRKGAYESFSNRRISRKSLTLTRHWHLANLVKTYHGIIVHQHRIDSRRMGIAEKAVRRSKEWTSVVCWNPAWMKCGGLIPWNVTAICEMSRTTCQMARHLMKGDLENHLKARRFLSVQWLNTIRFLRQTSQGSTNLVRMFFLEYSSDMSWSPEAFGKETSMVADMEELENLEASGVHAWRLNAMEIITQIKWRFFFNSQSQMEQQHCLEEITE